jgi:hypothetical protein
MRQALGSEVSSWIKEDRWLPQPRARQKAEPKLFAELVKYARKSRNPEHYLQKSCSPARWYKFTVIWLRDKIERAKDKAYDAAKRAKRMIQDSKVNPEGRAFIEKIKRQFFEKHSLENALKN